MWKDKVKVPPFKKKFENLYLDYRRNFLQLHSGRTYFSCGPSIKYIFRRFTPSFKIFLHNTTCITTMINYELLQTMKRQ